MPASFVNNKLSVPTSKIKPRPLKRFVKEFYLLKGISHELWHIVVKMLVDNFQIMLKIS